MNVICLDFLQIFGSHYGIPFLAFSISLLANFCFLKHCFIIAFSVFLLLFLQTVCCFFCCYPSPFAVLPCASGVLFHPCCCACLICTVLAVVPGVSLCVCVVFFEVAVYFLLLLLLLRRCGSVLSWCLLVAGVSSWFCGLLGASCVVRVVCVLFVVCFFLLLFFCWFCFVLGCPLFCGPPGVGCVWLLCCSSCWSSGWLSWLCCSVRFFAPGGVVVAPPVCCTVLVLVAPGWFMRLVVVLLVVGLLVLLSPLFLVRHDQARLCFSCGFNAECHPGWVAVWCFCSCGLPL